MTRITLQDGKVVLRDGQVGTEEACCCGECVCIPCGDGFTADFTITGSNAGEFSRTAPYGFELFGDSNGAVGELFGFTNLFCVDDEDVTFISLEINLQEIRISGGTSTVVSVNIIWICGSDYALDPGEWLVNLFGGMQTQALADIQNQPFNDTFLQVDYEKVYGPTDCTSEPVPFIDSNDMQGREGVTSPCYFEDGAPPTEPDPCPFRVTARLRRV